jgi:hypothetical protein
MMRSPASASPTIVRYRGSKMCSGRKTLGNRTTFGSGKRGMVEGSIADFRLQIANSLGIADCRLLNIVNC